jgi:rhodanese-related sulfurtransferase
MADGARIDRLLDAARKRLDRVEPADLASEVDGGALVVDTRPVEQRQRDGELPGAVVVDRNVLEWRLDPTSPNHIPEVTDADRRVIVVCNEGYGSSLAAATLLDLGLTRATDLIGGFEAWRELTVAAHHHQGTSDERWLASTLPFVQGHLPAAPARIIEIGCGPLGGFVPALRASGYDAVGIDPQAPEGSEYQRLEFERADLAQPAEAVVACVSLHHVADLDDVVDRIASSLGPAGVLVVVEWAWEHFDEATARWCFSRLGSDERRDEPGWLRRHRDDWTASGQPWDSYLGAWAKDEALHRGDTILTALETRFDTEALTRGPYFFADLGGISAGDEQAAIDTEQIQPSCILYVGRTRRGAARGTV